MKRSILFLLTIYKLFLSPIKNQLLGQVSMCRYPQTCSSYAKEAISRYGIMRGGKMAFIRLLSCSPLTRNTYAPTIL